MCDCIERLDEHLKKFNTVIHLPFWSASGVIAPFVETRKLDSAKRGKPRSVFASYCPFCGVKYQDDPAVTQKDAEKLQEQAEDLTRRAT